MGKLRSWEGECLTVLWVEWGFKLEPFGPRPWDKPLCCTVCACFSLLRWCRSSLPFTRWEQKGMKRDWLHQEMEPISENGAQWMHGVWETGFHLEPGTSFYLAKPSRKGKGYFGQERVPPSQEHQICPRCRDGSEAVEGFRDHTRSWRRCCLRFPLNMTLCDPVIWLPSSNTQSASEGLIIYSYAVRRFQEWFPSGILISTL